MADCCLIKKVATVEVYENKNEVRAYGFMAGDRNTPVMEVRFKHLWGESNLSTCKLRWIIVDDVGSLLVGEVPIQSDNTALINLPNELFTGDRRMKVQLTVASCDGERILNLQQFTDLKVINSLAPNEVVEPVYQILINALHDESQKYLKELETSYTQKYGSLDSLYKSARASLEQYLTTAENGGNAEFLQGYAPHNFKKTEDTIANLQASTKYKLGEVVELLGYYTAGDGAGHKRKIEETDDGSGVQLANGLWANIVHNGEVNVSWFGAKGDRITDDAEAIQKSFNYSSVSIRFDKGKFKVGTMLTLPPNKNICGNSIIDGVGIQGDNSIVINQTGDVRKSISLSQNVAIGALSINVNDVSGINVGDYILVRSTLDNSWSGTWGSESRTYRKQTFFQVKEITGNQIKLNEETNTTFESNSTIIDVLNTTTSSIKDLTILAKDTEFSNGISITYGLNCLFENVKMIGGQATGLRITKSINTTFNKCYCDIKATATNLQYPIAISSSQATLVFDCDSSSTRHAVAIVGDQCRHITIENSRLRGSVAPDAHGCADGFVYRNCDIHSYNGLVVAGRNGMWDNCRIFSENGSVIMATEIRSGRFIFKDLEITSYSSATAGSGWSPVDLGRGTGAISSNSRGDISFEFIDCKFNLPNLSGYFIRTGNTSPYKVNFVVDGLNLNMPNANQGIIVYEGNPTGIDADYVLLNNIYHNSTTNIPMFKGGSGATGYATTNIQYPINTGINGLYGMNGISIGNYGSLTSDKNSPYSTVLKTQGSSASFGEVVLDANARYGEIVFRTGFDASSKDVIRVAHNGSTVFYTMPKSTSGLVGGALWNNSGVVNIVPTSTLEANLALSSSLDTPYYALKMQQEGIYEDYVAYRDELHEYENSQVGDETMLLPVLQEPIIPESVKQFAEKYKLI